MNILVTGCAGFIGFHTAKKLLDRGDSVIGIDNLNLYYDINLKKARLCILKQYPNFKFYQLDIGEELTIEDEIHKICHLAAQAGVRYSLENPVIYEKSNNLGTLNIFEFARKRGIKTVVFASSSSVYGNCEEMPFKEHMQLDKPISIYAATKKSNEHFAHVYHHQYGINATGLRFFTVYGPWGRPDMALFSFTKKIIDDEPIDIYNNGEMKRDFTFVEDIADGILAALDREHGFEIINLARGESVPLIKFVEILEKHIGKEAKKNFMPLQAGDVVETSGDTSKARKLLGYNPKISIDEGIKRFVEWYKEYHNIK